MEVRTEIEISAPPAQIWKVLLDFRRYPEWNPFIVHLAGEPNVGSKLAMTLSLPDSNREREVTSRLLRCDTEQELRWLGHLWMKGLFDGEHFLRLEPRDDGTTRIVHGEDFHGIFLRFMMKQVTETTRGFVYMNQALKKRVEQGARRAR
ncbi:MAG TPA: SRPBCC domain-containing protein [Polyangiaceae bacterium]|nr:SRPBCC domain-containing protein [Polyangiaceae bacterium]